MTQCPFCARIEAGEGIIDSNDLAVAFFDEYPVSPGHTLVAPRRHEPDCFHLSEEEQIALLRLIHAAQLRLRNSIKPDGFNVGVNTAPAAGQTIPHAHVHVIPRFLGDVSDPRGGIRWVVPQKARYWPPTTRSF